MKHIIDFSAFNSHELKDILDTALDMKQNKDKYKHALKDKKLYMLFEKTSTRTFLSFAAGMEELGGSWYCQNWKDSNFCIGDIPSEVKYIGKSVDIFMARLKNHHLTNNFAAASTVPFINGCDNTYHPCQSLADFLTIKELFGDFQKNILYIGAQNNVFYSMVELAGKLGASVYGLTPLTNNSQIPEYFLDACKSSGSYIPVNPAISPADLKVLLKEIQVIYTDTWIDMEFFSDPAYKKQKDDIISRMMPYQINEDLLKDFSGVVFHDMPMHIGYEISQSAADQHMETILQQADNRKHAQKALMLYLLNG